MPHPYGCGFFDGKERRPRTAVSHFFVEKYGNLGYILYNRET